MAEVIDNAIHTHNGTVEIEPKFQRVDLSITVPDDDGVDHSLTIPLTVDDFCAAINVAVEVLAVSHGLQPMDIPATEVQVGDLLADIDRKVAHVWHDSGSVSLMHFRFTDDETGSLDMYEGLTLRGSREVTVLRAIE